MRPGENPPLGIILCGSKDREEVELLRLDDSGIRVAEYLTALPPRSVFEKKLHEAIVLAREQLAGQAEALVPETPHKKTKATEKS